MTSRPHLATAEVIGLPEAAVVAIQQVLASQPDVEAAMLCALAPSIRHPALLAHIERVGQVLYFRPDQPDWTP
jgi:hypothetical protein